jgi:hypothetical protein
MTKSLELGYDDVDHGVSLDFSVGNKKFQPMIAFLKTIFLKKFFLK